MAIVRIYTPDQIKSIENKAIKDSFLTEELLMENAAHSLFRAIKKYYKSYKIIILCGPGNNGGDGLALGRLLNSEGWNVKFSFLYPPQYKGVSLKNYNRAKSIDVMEIDNIPNDKETLLVDALFGIGLNRKLDKNTTNIIEKINLSKCPVLSIDIPSGIECHYGNIINGTVINADTTVTFIGYKLGMFSYPANKYCGRIIVSPISIDDSILNSEEYIYLNSPIYLNSRERDSHKTSNGKILTIAGSSSYFGAPYFASKAALLAGSGFSVLICPETISSVCAVLAPEVIYRTEKDLSKSIKSSSAVVFGPGVGLTEKSVDLLDKTVSEATESLIIDADGLTLLSEDLSLVDKITQTFVITPHPGEMARLLDRSIKEVEKDRIGSALSLSKKINAIVVLKGMFTVITTPKGEVFLNNCSSETLATSGSGDILSGIIAGLTGKNSLINSVRAGVFIHGLSGKIAEKNIGRIGVTATDILNSIPEAINQYTKLF